ncbi:MAG: hypothetical protein R3250_04270 [Melioribacteraceae bacterium]|nr:hypothetical protein [Melioribacteraceae bacterium]
MWHLLRSEINYHSILLTVAIVIFIQVILYLITPFYEQVNFVILTLFTIVFLSTLIERNKISIDRQNSALPFSIKFLGLERSLLVFTPWIILIPCFYLINFLLYPSNIENVTRLIGQLGFTLILVSSFNLVSDFYFSESIHDRLVKYLMTSISVMFIIIINVAYIFITNSLFNGLLAPEGIALIYTWGIFLTFLTAVSFGFRKSYL